MIAILKRGAEKVSGKRTSSKESAKWNELAELLVMELEMAAARTKSVSNVPAFLTEHLRRRLIDKQTNKKFIESDSTQAGENENLTEPDMEYVDPDPLTKQGRETVLKTMREYIEKGQREFVMSLQSTFTTEDWEYLIENLSIENK